MMNSTNIKELKDLLSSPKKIIIIPHRNPDGDAIGSSLGLYHVLVNQGHSAQVISPNDLPNFLNWMPGVETIKIYDKSEQESQKLLSEADIIFTLDFNILLRTGEKMGAFLEKLPQDFVMIDHHQMPGNYAKYTFSDPQYGSTCELMYVVLNLLMLAPYIDTNAATCIYTGIVTDSGSFKFPKTTAQTHRIVAELLDKGVKNAAIHNDLFDHNSFNKLQLMGKALQNIVLMPEQQTSYLFLTEEDLYKYNHQKGDTEGLVNYGLSIDGIHFTAFFIERKEEGIIKISFRSQGDVDVNQFARKYFEGGGHINAAGGKSNLNLEETIARFKKIVENEKIVA